VTTTGTFGSSKRARNSAAPSPAQRCSVSRASQAGSRARRASHAGWYSRSEYRPDTRSGGRGSGGVCARPEPRDAAAARYVRCHVPWKRKRPSNSCKSGGVPSLPAPGRLRLRQCSGAPRRQSCKGESACLQSQSAPQLLVTAEAVERPARAAAEHQAASVHTRQDAQQQLIAQHSQVAQPCSRRRCSWDATKSGCTHTHFARPHTAPAPGAGGAGTCLTDAGPSVQQMVSRRLYAIRVAHACTTAVHHFHQRQAKQEGVLY
jgi:hypothetical protein